MKRSLLLASIFCMLSFFSYAQIQTPQVKLKFGKGLQVTAADSSMLLKTSFRFQSLYTSERSLAEGSDWTSQFLVRRARLKFDGWAMSPRLVYKVELALSNKDLKSSNDYEESSEAPKVILDAVLKWKMMKNLSLWVGQTKLPGNRERVVSSQKLQFVDRSLVNSIFNIDREMGLQLRGKMNLSNILIKPSFALSFGEGRNVTMANVGGYNYTGRVEFLPMGEFSSKGDYFEGDLKREKSPKVAFGVTYNFNKGASRQKQSGRFLVDTLGNYFEHDLQTVFVDFIFKYNGFSFLGEYANKMVTDKPLTSQDFELRNTLIDANGKSYYTGSGINMQLSYLFKNNVELAGRYTHVMPDAEMSFTGIDEYTIGLSKYIVGHSLKVQGDVSLIDKEGASDSNLRYRLQMEFAF